MFKKARQGVSNNEYIYKDGKIGYKKQDATIDFNKYQGYKTMFAYLHERD